MGYLFSCVAWAEKNEDLDHAAHIYQRLAFGPRPGDVEKLAAGGQKAIHQWIEEQLHPEKFNDPQVELRLSRLKSIHMSMEQLKENYDYLNELAKKAGINPDLFNKDENVRKEFRKKTGDDHLLEKVEEELVSARLIRAVEGHHQLEEVLFDFWYNHFNVDLTKGQDRWLVTPYEKDALRPHLFGKFKDLLKATAKHPAMLFYLDNHLNKRDGVNENYAREIMELHTLGVDGGYTQKDVTEAARILTGWSVDDFSDPSFKFKEKVHDRGEKKILGHTFPADRGEEEVEEFFDLIASHPATAHHISLKLCQFFIRDNPPEELVKKVAQKFKESDGDLRAMYATIFNSREFWNAENREAKIKSPFFYVVSAIRANGGEVDFKSEVGRYLNELGEPLYRCAPPTGYSDKINAWVNPGSLVLRINFGLKLAANRVEGVFVQLPHFDHVPKTPLELVHQIAARLIHSPLSETSKKVILKEFDAGESTIADDQVRPIAEAKAVGLILGSPEFQRR